jgi:DNA invertase Pin-like site-specific DNA recombinase
MLRTQYGFEQINERGQRSRSESQLRHLTDSSSDPSRKMMRQIAGSFAEYEKEG